MDVKDLYVADRAEITMIVDIGRFPDKETGGILLGYFHEEEGDLEVLEATDSGPNGIHGKSHFSFDQEYTEHQVSFLSRMHHPPLKVIGVWHKHNHAYNPPFSEQDEELHIEMLETSKAGVVSILFQKVEEDQYKMRKFYVAPDGTCKEFEDD